MGLRNLSNPEKKFMCQDAAIENSDVVVLPVPYDLTASYMKGTAKAPAEILNASSQLEGYDTELQLTTCDKLKICTLESLPVEKKPPEEMADAVADAVSEILELGKKPVILGGEHSISAGAVRPFKDEEFSVLQIDAHADLRDSYEGSRYSHACTMRRIREITDSAVQLGIRAVSSGEMEYIEKEDISGSIFYAHDFSADKIPEIIGQLNERVYVTVDVDGFDPSVMPGTGTPQPGGLGWQDVTSVLKEVGEKRKVVGFDIVEAIPVPPIPVTEFAAATLAYRMMGYFWARP